MSDLSDFKNFHRLLCERFGYVHDEKDWQRDQLSLIEWIAKRVPPEVEDALNVTHQALLEVRHAQECGASWYTRGENGLYGQVAMWVRKGFAAIDAAKKVITFQSTGDT